VNWSISWATSECDPPGSITMFPSQASRGIKRDVTPNSAKPPKDKLLPKISLAFFNRPKLTLVIWLALIGFGALSYTTLLKREGFPSVNIPLTIVNGTYFVGDSAKVDSQITKPITDLAVAQHNTSMVQSQSSGNFYNIVIQYKDGVDAHKAASELQQEVKAQVRLPSTATVKFNVPYFGVTGGDAKKIDDVISLYKATGGATTAELVAPAQKAVDYLNAHKPSLVKEFFLRNPYQTSVDPATGKPAQVQQSFDRYSVRTDDTTRSYTSVTIGVTGVDNVDVIKLDKQLEPLLANLHNQPGLESYAGAISASNAPQIQDEIHELQRVLLEGLIAVLVIGSIVIALRASFITVLAMATVILTTLGVLYLINYSLNVITLFALILGLSLIVDDTIIMTEAIDAVRRKSTDGREIILTAVRKISRAMVAATLTATLSFAPLLFVGGILGSFIRAIPVTIIAALLISLFVALVLIPFFARGLLLRPKQLGKKGVLEVAAGVEGRIASAIARPMIWAKGSTKRLFSVGITAVIVSLLFIFSAGLIFGKVTFNIFPATKDTNALSVGLTFKPGTTIAQAEQIARDADKLSATTLGSTFVNSTYYGMGSETQAMSVINIISYNQRSVTSPQLVKQLQQKFDTNFTEAVATVSQVDVGPPAAAFTVEIRTEDRSKGYQLANDVKSFMEHATLTRLSGTKAHFTNVTISNPNQYIRNNGQLSIDVTGNFNGTDTSTLVTLGQDAIKKEFTANKVKSYGLPASALAFNIGQESENQNSFKSLAIAFPIMLLVMYLLLFIEFRSLLQPLLIFIAIPFSLFGITLGLYLTHNAFSFFAALGFFALIGLSLKNTILLTDYANQSRRNGMGAVDSAVAALGERFRPLVATSLTAVVSLIPLAVTSPFWQGLAVVLIFGLLSSTLLVILVFPYYYLGGEYLRTHIRARSFFLWLIPTLVVAIALGKLVNGTLVPIVIFASLAATIISGRMARRHA
jgi:multidrug efflux pump subunit AcrB